MSTYQHFLQALEISLDKVRGERLLRQALRPDGPDGLVGGGAVFIDFNNPAAPIVEKVDFRFCTVWPCAVHRGYLFQPRRPYRRLCRYHRGDGYRYRSLWKDGPPGCPGGGLPGQSACFLSLVNASGLSSSVCLQNTWSIANPRQQAIPLPLSLGRELLEGTGAIRVHGGGFAGTIQAFVPNGKLDRFKSGMEALLGEGKCHILHIRPQGGCVAVE